MTFPILEIVLTGNCCKISKKFTMKAFDKFYNTGIVDLESLIYGPRITTEFFIIFRRSQCLLNPDGMPSME